MGYRVLLVATGLACGIGWLVTSTSSTSFAEPKSTNDFGTAVVPFLQKHCYQCHGDKKQSAEVKLSEFTTEASLLKNRKLWNSVIRVVESGEMPPANRPRPATPDQEKFLVHVRDLFDRADRAAPPDPGRVTVRRLNRTEYNNTIRDLVGVDFNPAEDFPSDDIGYGFDNIGDVLTLSPVLMERYLAAAESITNRAIMVDVPKPPARHLSARYTEPASANVPMQGNFRIISTKGEGVQTGPIHTAYQVPSDGEYTFRAKVYAEGTGTIQVAILAHGKTIPTPATDADAAKLIGLSGNHLRPFVVLKTFDITARDAKSAQTIEARVPANIGLERMAVARVKRAGDDDSKVFLEALMLDGPLDPRPASHRRLLACDASKPKTEQTREILQRFANRAYRRPVTKEEVDRLVALAEKAVSNGEKWEAGIQLAMQAVLVSPKFLFRLELDQRPESPNAQPLNEYQVASRLSYFLWSSMPDDELFALAARGELTRNLDAQVHRMLKDPKAKALVDNFAMQWLQLRRIQTFAPDAKLFPQFDDKLRNDMIGETSRFFEAIMREDRNVLELLDSDFTFLNERLARHYGIIDTMGNTYATKMKRPGGQPIRGEKFVRVQLPAGGDRGGLLTQASILTVTSNPTRTSPVKRGRWVLEQILGTPPPPPPPDVPELDEAKAELKGTLRQRMEQHRANPSCASCHARMDPIGFAFENFNAVGAFRDKDGDAPIDPSGTLPDGKSFQGPAELKAILKGKKTLFTRNLAEKMLTYATGRGMEVYDKRAIDRIIADMAKHDDKFSSLIIAIVKSDPFLMRRGSKQ